MQRTINICPPDNVSWQMPDKQIRELVGQLELEDLDEFIDPFIPEYSSYSEMSTLFLEQEAQSSDIKTEAMRNIAIRIIEEDLLVLPLDLKYKRGYVKKTEEGYSIAESEERDLREPYARAARLSFVDALSSLGFKTYYS